MSNSAPQAQSEPPAVALAADSPETDKLSRQSVTVIVTLLVATFVVILNETILNVALPHLMSDLSVNESTVQWLATGFMLTMAVVIPTTGFILERLSTRQAFLLAIGLFTAGTALAVVSQGFAMLLVARVIQAAGTAVMMPLLMTTILTLVPMSKRGMVMGNITIAISVAPALGPTVSGLILANFSWRFIFLFVLPIAIAAMIIGAKFLTNVGETGQQKLDTLSVLLTVPAFGGLVYGLSQLGNHDAGSTGVSVAAVTALAIGVVSMLLFVVRQLRLQKHDAPLLDLRAFNYRMFTVSVLLMVVAMLALFGSVILLPIYLQRVLHVDTLTTGLLLLPGGLAMGLTGPFIGRLYDKFGPKPLTISGSILMVLSLWQYSMLTDHTELWWIAIVQTVLNVALALIFTPAFTNGLNPLPPALYSHGSAIISTLQQVAGAAGTALLVSIFAIASAASGNLVVGTQAAFLTAALIAVVAVILSVMMRRTGDPANAAAAAHH
ncbi:MDR family MFS transporter [Pseudarthrobacter sp. J1738]|uniref:MDR family MFS transporter n=1 Tax=Pseudarthrobacter sp. J1738 TaxID=3420446 RepID=UPI003D2D6AF5